MKSILTIAGVVLTALAAIAQTSEGKIIYEQKTNNHKYLTGEAEQYKSFVPEFTTAKMQLDFKGSQSLYKQAKTDEAELPSTEGGNGGFRMMMRNMNANSVSFKDYETGLATDIRELGPKKYLLDDTLQRISWKLSSDTMTIMGHLCHKATATLKGGVMSMMQGQFGGGRQPGAGGPQQPAVAGAADSTRRNRFSQLTRDQAVVAWYADDITSPAGPQNFYGLPGTILKLDIDEGFMVFTPLEISATPEVVKAPTSGKKITREEYYKMVREQAESMRSMMGGRNGGGFRQGGPM